MRVSDDAGNASLPCVNQHQQLMRLLQACSFASSLITPRWHVLCGLLEELQPNQCYFSTSLRELRMLCKSMLNSCCVVRSENAPYTMGDLTDVVLSVVSELVDEICLGRRAGGGPQLTSMDPTGLQRVERSAIPTPAS